MARSIAWLLLVLACARTDGGANPAGRDEGRPPAAVAAPAGPDGFAPGNAGGSAPGVARQADVPRAGSPFGRLIEALSERGGFFPSDNLVSNETSYMHVLPTLRSLGVSGGAYVGVGPDQNFTYIAHIRPEIAFIIDIRRDNLLYHLLFKAAFEAARNRLEFLGLILGRPLPADVGAWDEAAIDEIVIYMDTASASADRFEDANVELLAAVLSYGVPLTEADLQTIRFIHAAFHDAGLGLRYSSTGGRRSTRFPTWRQLLLQEDLRGDRWGYLASEANFRRVKRMQHEDRIVPVVGDLGGPAALEAIGREISRRGLTISAFYVSNVEQYLMRGPEFDRFAATVTGLPVSEKSVLIRSYFARRWPIPQLVPGHYSAQLLERMADFVAAEQAGGYLGYMDLVTRNAVPLVDQPAGTTG